MKMTITIIARQSLPLPAHKSVLRGLGPCRYGDSATNFALSGRGALSIFRARI